MGQGIVPQGQDVLFGNHLQEIQDLLVLAEDEGVKGGLRILRAHAGEHRLRQDEAPHLREEDHQDLARRWSLPGVVPRPGKKREKSAQGGAHVSIDSPLKADIHSLIHPIPPIPADDELLPDIVHGYETVQNAKTPKGAAEAIREFKLPREAVPTEFLNSVEVWQALLDAGMPLTAMIRTRGRRGI